MSNFLNNSTNNIFNQTINSTTQFLETELDSLEEEVIQDLPDTSTPTKSFQDFITKFKYYLNLIFISIPYDFFTFTFLIFVFYMEMVWFKYFAYGNVFLIFNFIYLVIQSFLSLIIVAEVPIWLRYMKIVRFGSLMVAIVFIGIWGVQLADFIWLLLQKEYQVVFVMEQLVFGYLLILNTLNMPVSFIIVVKEILIEI